MRGRHTKFAFRKGDIYLIGGALLAALILCGLWLLFSKDGGAVIVERDGRETARYALNEDRTVKLEGEGGYNLLVIQDGEVWLSEADCPNRLCVKMGKIRGAGQSIVCLPHRLVVRIIEGASPLDAVTGP